MTARYLIFLVTGILLILLNIITDIKSIQEGEYNQEAAYNIGYIIGSHFMLFFGVLFLRIAYKTKKKIRLRKGNPLERDIGMIGKQQP